MAFDPRFYSTQKMPTAQFVKQHDALLAEGWMALTAAKDTAGTVTLLKKLPTAPTTNTLGAANVVRKHASKSPSKRKPIAPAPRRIAMAPQTKVSFGKPLTERAKVAFNSLHPPPIPKPIQPMPVRQTKAGSYTMSTVPKPHTRLRHMPTDGHGAKKTPIPKKLLTATQLKEHSNVKR